MNYPKVIFKYEIRNKFNHPIVGEDVLSSQEKEAWDNLNGLWQILNNDYFEKLYQEFELYNPIHLKGLLGASKKIHVSLSKKKDFAPRFYPELDFYLPIPLLKDMKLMVASIAHELMHFVFFDQWLNLNKKSPEIYPIKQKVSGRYKDFERGDNPKAPPIWVLSEAIVPILLKEYRDILKLPPKYSFPRYNFFYRELHSPAKSFKNMHHYLRDKLYPYTKSTWDFVNKAYYFIAAHEVIDIDENPEVLKTFSNELLATKQ